MDNPTSESGKREIAVGIARLRSENRLGGQRRDRVPLGEKPPGKRLTDEHLSLLDRYGLLGVVNACVDLYGVGPELPMAASLGVAMFCASRSWLTQTPALEYGKDQPLCASVWLAGESGDRKSDVMSSALAPLVRWCALRAEQAREDEDDGFVWPIEEDVTIEGVCDAMRESADANEGRAWVLIANDEVVTQTGNFSHGEQQINRTEGVLTKAYDGKKNLKVRRGTKGSVSAFIKEPSVSMLFAGREGEIYGALYRGNVNGFAARAMAMESMDEPRDGRATEEQQDAAREGKAEYERIILGVLDSKPWEPETGWRSGVLRLSREAVAEYDGHGEWLAEKKRLDLGVDPYMKARRVRSRVHVLRMAATLAVLKVVKKDQESYPLGEDYQPVDVDYTEFEVDADCVRDAIELERYFFEEIGRHTAAQGRTPEMIAGLETLNWLRDHHGAGEFTWAVVGKGGPYSVRSGKPLSELVEQYLVKMGAIEVVGSNRKGNPSYRVVGEDEDG